MEASTIPDRPALGQLAALGSCYDARTDTFSELSIFKTEPPADAISTTEKHCTETKYSEGDTYKEKFDLLSIKAELGASILSDLTDIAGSGCYLSEKRNSDLLAEASMHYNITTVEETLNLTASGVADCLAFQDIDTDVATHVVMGITWGARGVVTAKRLCATQADRAQLVGELQKSLGVLKPLSIKTPPKTFVEEELVNAAVDPSLEITVHGDLQASDGLTPTDCESAMTFIGNLPEYIEATNGGKGNPISYCLMPLSLLGRLNLLSLKTEVAIHQLNVDCLEKFVKLFDDFQGAQRRLYDYYSRVQSHSPVVPPGHVQDVGRLLNKMRGREATTKSAYAAVLKEVRSGRADAQQLWRLLEKCQNRRLSTDRSQKLMMYGEKMDFVDLITSEGAKYVGYGGPAVSALLQENREGDAYIMYFNDELRINSDDWDPTTTVLLELLRDRSRDKLIIVVDSDATETPLEKIHVSQIHSGTVITEDFLEQRKMLATNCVMRFNEDAIDRSSATTKPLQRRAVKIHCPHPDCDRTLEPNWICSICHTIVEYGYTDDLLYCDCGCCHFGEWEHKCNDPKHGSDWVKFDSATFKVYLDKLEPFQELNILILGETGVGKSTWINAFINYLSFDTLDEAISADELKWAIPCCFHTQVLESGRFVQRAVKVGDDNNEKDGSAGQSATQATTVYAVDINNLRVRLIDTPGIGDTRGVDQDNKNMADILRVLRSYNNLHGILILLKPNAPRLTVMFRFCIKQLLTHLHRNASKNIAFGFTNTRASSYKPGDTFKPLEKLLTEYAEIDMGLFEDNVYCFDSESFRYLAAQKRGIDMEWREDNARSWEYSVAECHRLVKHFKGITPHQVRSTINLNETRNIIVQLTEPMAMVSQKISASITVNEEQLEELQRTKLSRTELEKRLFVQKETLSSVEVDMPRTVCTNPECVEFRSDFEGRDETTIIYKTMCHRPCYLGGVMPRSKGDPGLLRCAAMDVNGKCGCGHVWMDHMHIYYEYQPMTYKHRDEAVDTDLLRNATTIELKEKAIRMKTEAIEEYKLEYAQMQAAAIQFGFFLKRHAIIPYNDATLEYIDMLIDQEKMKLNNGGKTNRDNLDTLEKYRREHVEKVAAIRASMERGEESEVLDDAGIRQAIDTIFGLPHFGRDLRAIISTNERAAEATYREKSCNVSAGSHWGRKPGSSRQKNGAKGSGHSNGNAGGGGSSGSRATSPIGSWFRVPIPSWWTDRPVSPPPLPPPPPPPLQQQQQQQLQQKSSRGGTEAQPPGAFPGALPGAFPDTPLHGAFPRSATDPINRGGNDVKGGAGQEGRSARSRSNASQTRALIPTKLQVPVPAGALPESQDSAMTRVFRGAKGFLWYRK